MSRLEEELEDFRLKRDRRATNDLLAALRKHHEPPVSEILSPIPDKDIAAAAEIAFPSWVNEVTRIQHAICREWGVSKVDLLSARRTEDVVVPRQAAMFLARRLGSRSLPEIGHRFGGRDHTTVIHAVRKTEERMAADPLLRARVHALAESLGGTLE